MTESRPPYQTSGSDLDKYDSDGFDKDGFDASGYDKNGLDRWGITLVEKEEVFAKLAKRFEEQPDSMAALMVEYRRQEGMSQENLLAKLEITPAQYSHLALCFVPDPDAAFASDIGKIVATSGANIEQLVDICRQVYAMRDFPKRVPAGSTTQPDPVTTPVRAFSMRASAARDREQHAKTVREESADYSVEVNAAASPAPLAAGATPKTDSPKTDPPKTDPPTEMKPTSDEESSASKAMHNDDDPPAHE